MATQRFIPIACVLVGILLAACSQTNQQTPSGDVASPITASSTVSVYRGTVPVNSTNRQCSLDIIDGQPAANVGPVASGSTVIFGGWAGNGSGQATSGSILVFKSAQHAYSVSLATGVPRSDVAKALNSAGMAKAGFNLSAEMAGVHAGTYSLFVVDPADPATDCDLHRTLTVQ